MVDSTATKRKLVLKMSVSLDGFVCGPDGEADWIFRSAGGADSTAWLLETLRGAGLHVMGSRSYYDMAAFWPFSQLPIAAPMNEIPKLVFSRTGLNDGTLGRRTAAAADEAALRSWAEPVVASGDLVEEIQRLKAQPGNYLLAHGGARFARSLVAAGLVDEYRLAIHPVVLGRGQALFSGLEKPLDLRLASMTPFASGALAAVYRPA
jgi:dihydrofolate reductase